MQDTIVREITLNASKERVYAYIADSEKMTQWFPDKIEEGSLEAGQSPIFCFGPFKTRVYIEAANPYDYFAYRWVPGTNGTLGNVLATANTLVEFSLTESKQGTLVTLKESGFASLPQDVIEKSLKENNHGWDTMTDRLLQLINKS